MKYIFSKIKNSTVLNFIAVFIISLLAFEGVEHLIHEFFGIDMHDALAFGGAGTVIFFIFKFHIACCAIPALGSSIYCTYKKHKHCDHEHHNAVDLEDSTDLPKKETKVGL